MTDILRVALRELVRRLEPQGILLFVIGGYGLVLRTNAIAASGQRTLGGNTPVTRSTEDIDLVLSEAFISDPVHTKQIRATLTDLGYTVVTGRENFQFEKAVALSGRSQSIKIDWHTGPVSDENAGKVKVAGRRTRPKHIKGLHAHTTNEAVFVEDSAMSINVADDDSPAIVRVPHPFAYLMLKLFALNDVERKDVPSDHYHHALDMFTIWATITEREYDEALLLREKHADNAIARDARAMMTKLFDSDGAYGILALKVAAQEAQVELKESSIERFRTDLLTILGSN